MAAHLQPLPSARILMLAAECFDFLGAERTILIALTNVC
jgi:hypothetical protein